MEISFHEKAVQMLFCVTEQRCLCLGVPAYPSGCAHWSAERARAWFPYDCSVRALGGSGSSAPARIFPGQAARPVPLHQACKGINTTSFSIVGFAFCFFVCLFHEGSSQFQRSVQEIWSFSPQTPVCHFFYEAAPLILPPKCDADAAGSQKAVLPSALVESNQGMQQQQIQQPKPCGWEKSAWNSNVVSTGTAMPQQL